MKIQLSLVTCLALSLAGSATGQGDPEVVARIIDEGKNNSQVWDHLEYLSNEIGTRLTGSSRVEEANHWTMARFADFGLSNCHLHEWGTLNLRFDRGPSSAAMVEPRPRDLEFTTPSWSWGTDGPVRGPVFKVPKTLEELGAIRGQLEGAWILTTGRQRGGRRGVVPPGTTPEVAEEINEILKEAGIAGRIIANRDELVRTFSSERWSNLQEMTLDELDKEVSVYVRRSDYDTMNSRIADGETVELDINLDNKFTEGPFPLYNTVAEIPGSVWPEQIVIVSAHLDSWDGPGAQGSQDNGTGSSVTLEAARLLMAAGARPKRTIRFILWTGEEQGLLGSRAYVASLSEEEKANISVCFVDDGGTNYEGGLSCLESMVPMLTEATAAVTEAFPEMPVEIRSTSRIRGGGGSDHASFNAVGIPGFFWMESGSGGREGKNYRFIHHTQHDTPRYAVPEYLVQSATCAAVTAYNLACADTLLPRQVVEAEPERPRRRPQAAPDGVVGTWAGSMVVDGVVQEGTFTLHLVMGENGEVTGKTESEMGEGTISDGKYDKATGELTFVVNHADLGRIDFKAKVAGAKMTGTLGIEDQFEVGFEARLKDD